MTRTRFTAKPESTVHTKYVDMQAKKLLNNLSSMLEVYVSTSKKPASKKEVEI